MSMLRNINPHFPLLFLKECREFIGQNDIVLNVSGWNKGILHCRDELGNHGFQSVCQNLNNDFVDNFTQTDRSKVMDNMRT
jgi:hypothetical protein